MAREWSELLLLRDPAPAEDPEVAVEAHRGVFRRLRESLRATREAIGGEVWTARAFDDEQVIDAGEQVEVVQIRGATALVMP